jgi:THO complex subunit 1
LFAGLNVVSEFNLDNVTEFIDDSAGSLKDAMEVDDPEEVGGDGEKKFKIDYNLYSKFLTLQDFFRSPTQCYNKVRWRVFVNVSCL